MNVQISGWARLLESGPPGTQPAAPSQGEKAAKPSSGAAHAPTSPPEATAPEASSVAPPGLDLALLDDVSPEMILSLVRLRMDDVDMQIQSRSEEILRSTDRADELSNQLQALEAIKAKTVSQGGKDPSIEYDNDDRDAEHLVQLHGQPFTVAEVAARYGLTDDLESLEKGGEIKASALGDLVESRRQELQRTNSGNEIKMMELQQLMQRRAEVLSLGTNLLRTLHEATQQIVRNLGV